PPCVDVSSRLAMPTSGLGTGQSWRSVIPAVSTCPRVSSRRATNRHSTDPLHGTCVRSVTERALPGPRGRRHVAAVGRGDGHGGDTVRRPSTAQRLHACLAAVAFGGAAAGTLALPGTAAAATRPAAAHYPVHGIPGVPAAA